MVQVGQLGLADGDQLARLRDGLHVTRPAPHAKRRNPEVAPMTDLARGDVVHHLGGELGQQLAVESAREAAASGLGALRKRSTASLGSAWDARGNKVRYNSFRRRGWTYNGLRPGSEHGNPGQEEAP